MGGTATIIQGNFYATLPFCLWKKEYLCFGYEACSLSPCFSRIYSGNYQRSVFLSVAATGAEGHYRDMLHSDQGASFLGILDPFQRAHSSALCQ